MERRFSGRRLLAAVALAALCAGMGGVSAQARENYAIVVGVTDYPNLPKNNWLVGPRNDAVMVREYLTTRSPVKFEADKVSILAEWAPSEFRRRESELHKLLSECGSIFGRLAEQHARIGTHRGSVSPTQQLVYRFILGLTLDVPEGNVGAADRMNRCTAPSISVCFVVHLLPEPFGIERIFAQQDRR